MQIGIIGTGNMGTIIAESLLISKAVQEENLYITNRTREKALKIKVAFPKIHVLPSPEEVVKKAHVVFICLKPLDIYPLLDRIGPLFREDQCLVSITSPITTEQLESVVSCSCIRAIPSITNRALSGVSLFTYGKNCTDEWKEKVTGLFSAISKPIEIDESITRVASDIVSCGPAFFSLLLQKFIDAAVKETTIEKEKAEILTAEMMIGMGELLKKQIYTLPSLEKKVNVKGGITGKGLEVLEKSSIGDTFRQLFQATHRKFQEDMEAVQKQFEGNYD